MHSIKCQKLLSDTTRDKVIYNRKPVSHIHLRDLPEQHRVVYNRKPVSHIHFGLTRRIKKLTSLQAILKCIANCQLFLKVQKVSVNHIFLQSTILRNATVRQMSLGMRHPIQTKQVYRVNANSKECYWPRIFCCNSQSFSSELIIQGNNLKLKLTQCN